MKRFKFIRKGFKSENGNHKWIVGKWYTFKGELEMCESGFHCSKGIYQAFSYVQGEILAEVEVKGKHLVEKDKEVWEKMRVVKAYKWTKKDSVLFSCYAARLVLKLYEDKYPNDDRPRKAIEAAENYSKHPTEKNRRAAKAASWAAKAAARAVEAAYWAAGAAARAAEAAYWATRAVEATSCAAKAASWAAKAASWAARASWAAKAASWAARVAYWAAGAASCAAKAAIHKSLDVWMLKHLKELKPL